MQEMYDLSLRELLQLHSRVGDELRDRQACRTGNNPVGDIAENLFSKAFGWPLEPNSKVGFDARCSERGRMQIKSRRLSRFNSSRQAGDIRDLDQLKFDWLAGIVFLEDWSVHVAVLIPHALIMQKSIPIPHSRSSRIYLRDNWVAIAGVVDVTVQLRESWAELSSKLPA